MYLQFGWGNWNLLVSFLHQHKQFTRLTHTTTFPGTQISENSGKISDVFWSFLEVQATSSTILSKELCQSLFFGPEHQWTRTMTTTHNSSRSAADNAGFLLPSRTSQKRIFMFSFEPLFTQNSPPKLFSSFEISFSVSTTKDRHLFTEFTH